MPWEVKDVMEQRIEFVVRVLRKERKMGELCKEYGISRTTGVSVVESVPGDRDVSVALRSISAAP